MIFAIFFSCTQPSQDTAVHNLPVDHTMDFGEKTGQLQLISPVYTVPPYTEQERCLFYTYMGPDMFFTKGISYQNPDFGHHADIDVGTLGEIYDVQDVGNSCEKAMDFVWNPIVEARSTISDGIAYGDYPEGMGYRITAGTMIMLQSHHVNTTDQTVLVNDRFDLHLSPPEEITYPAAPIELGDEDFLITEGAYEYSFECIIDEDVKLAWIAGHMHEYGAYQYIDRIRDGESVRIYEVENWLEEYYLTAPVADFLPDGNDILAGDILKVTCGWNNTSGAPMEHPTEMCYTGGIIFPHEDGIYCNASEPPEEPPDDDIENYEWVGGELIFTEIQLNPCGDQENTFTLDCRLADTKEEYQSNQNQYIGWGEWIELYNTTSRTLNLAGLTFVYQNRQHTFPNDYFIKPHAFILLGNNPNFGRNGHLPIDLKYPLSIELDNYFGSLSLFKDSLLIDSMSYSQDYLRKTQGKTLSLHPDFFTSQANDDQNHWCLGQTVYGYGDFGTPLLPNDHCK